MADFKLTADESEIIKSLDNIEKKLAETGNVADSTGKKIGHAFTETEGDTKRAAASLAEYTAAQEKLKAGAQDRINKNKELKDSLEKYRREQEILNAATEDGAKKNFEVASSMTATTAATKGAEAATKGATVAQRLFNFVMSLNPLGLLIAAFALLVNQLRQYQGVIDTASKITSQIGAVFTEVTNRAISLGKSIYALVTLDFAGFGQNAAAGINGFGDAVVNAWTEAGKLADNTTALRDAQLAAIVSTAKLTAASEKYQAIAGQESKSFNDRISALKTAIGLEAEIARIKVGFAQKDAENARAEFALSNKNVEAKEALNTKELALIGAQNDASKTRIGLLGQLNELEKQRLDFIAKNLEDVTKLIDKLDVALAEDPTDKKIEQINQGVEAQVRAIEEGIAKIAEVEKLRPLSEEEIALRQNLQDKIVGVIELGDKQVLQTILDGAAAQMEAQEKIDKAKADAAKKSGEDAKKALKDILDLQNARIDITEAEFDNLIKTLQAGGAKEEDVKKAQLEFDKQINGERLKAELEFQKAILALTPEGTGADIIRARIQEIQTLLEGLDISGKAGKNDGKPKKNIWDLLGFDEPTGEALSKAFGEIEAALGSLAEARVNEAEAATKAAQDKVAAAEEALAGEKKSLDEGLANNYDARKKDLDNAKKLRDEALKEETKARKAQIALDTVGQVSGLITSSVNIFQSLSKLGPIGIALAVVTIGAMLTAFAATKAKALKAAEPPKLRKGDKIIGRTHEQGGELRELEHGEQVVGAGEAAGQDVFFERMRKGQYKGLDLAALAESKGDYQSPISGAAARTTALRERRERATETMHYNALSKTYERVGADIVEAIKRKPLAAPWKQGYKLIKETGHGTDTTTYQPAD